MSLAWVLGAGGLLGSALCRALSSQGTRLFTSAQAFQWTQAETLAQQIHSAAQQFANDLQAGEAWEVHWAAGASSMGSLADALTPETAALNVLLQALAAQPALQAAPGAITLASSAGAIYAGAGDVLVSEATPPAPTTPYAQAKLAQEALLRDSALARQGQQVTVLLARLATLYGRTPNPDKPQGLLSHIARSILRNQPVQIYVPFDTLRDYLSADDAAVALLAALQLARTQAPGMHMKIIASEQPVSVAEIVSLFRRIARRAPRVVTSASRLGSLYPRRAQFRSTVLLSQDRPIGTSLAVGIAQLMAAERLAYVRGTHTPAEIAA
jgi:UDP-glucose 4-epimerase